MVKHVQSTLCYLLRDHQMLMIRGVKKYAPHYGYYNGLGGKFAPEDGDDPARCCIREVQEESGYTVTPEDLACVGKILFTGVFPDQEWTVHMYTCNRFTGEQRSDPTQGPLLWADIGDNLLPNAPILEGDTHFIPWVLAGRYFEAHFMYNGQRYLSHTVTFPSES